jgi:hypothetical protein
VGSNISSDMLGTMLTKADVGTYTHPPAGAAPPHGVASISGSDGTTSFAYDGTRCLPHKRSRK